MIQRAFLPIDLACGLRRGVEGYWLKYPSLLHNICTCIGRRDERVELLRGDNVILIFFRWWWTRFQRSLTRETTDDVAKPREMDDFVAEVPFVEANKWQEVQQEVHEESDYVEEFGFKVQGANHSGQVVQ